MYEIKFYPRFSDTDALGHINNASFSTWFETARRPIFELFIPDLDPKKWNLILARMEIDFVAQGFYQKETTVTTRVEKIGNSSFVLVQEAKQSDQTICSSKAFMVHFDYNSQKSSPITGELRDKLSQLT